MSFEGPTKLVCKMLDYYDYIIDNSYEYSRFEYPAFTEKHTKNSYPGSILNLKVSDADKHAKSLGFLKICARNCRLIVYPINEQGTIGYHYILLGRSNSCLLPNDERGWLKFLEHKLCYGGINLEKNEIELSISYMSSYRVPEENLNYIMGHNNHGHWLQDGLSQAILASTVDRNPILIQNLDRVKLDSLMLAGIEHLILPPVSEPTIFEFNSLNLYSRPPPSLIPDLFCLRYEKFFNYNKELTIQMTKAPNGIFLTKSKGNMRLIDSAKTVRSLEWLGIREVDPIKLPFIYLLQVCNYADIIIAPFGAEAFNMLFNQYSKNIVIVPDSVLRTAEQIYPIRIQFPIASSRAYLLNARLTVPLKTLNDFKMEMTLSHIDEVQSLLSESVGW